MAKLKKKKPKQPKLDSKLDTAVRAAYKLGQMNMWDMICREIREGSPN